VIWLVCPKCGIKEWLNDRTPIAPCECGSARHAEDDTGVPYILWSIAQDANDWSVPEGAGSFDFSGALSSPPSKKEGGDKT
jgi:hypothetical protein